MQTSESSTVSVVFDNKFWDVVILSGGGTPLTAITGFSTEEKANTCIVDLIARSKLIKKEETVQVNQRPPIGIKPQWLIQEERLEEIQAAALRYFMAGQIPPSAWSEEAQTLSASIEARKKSGKPVEPFHPAQ